MGDVIRRNAVVMEEPPAAFVANDAVMGGPAYDGLQKFALETEGAVRVVACSKAEQVTVASRVGEVVATASLVHPRCFEKAMGVTGLEGLTVGIQNDDWARSLCKLQDIVAHAHHKRWQGWSVGGTEELRLLVGSRAEVNAILR